MDYICTNCSYVGQRKKVKSGSNLVSIMLWTVLPSIYMLWSFASIGPALMQDPASALQNMQAQGSGVDNIINIILIFPGPAYSIWRRVKKVYACPQCNEKIMLPAGRNNSFAGIGSSGKEHEIEIEIKLAQMEQQLQQSKPNNARQEVAMEKPVIQEEVDTPPVKREWDERSKNEW